MPALNRAGIFDGIRRAPLLRMREGRSRDDAIAIAADRHALYPPVGLPRVTHIRVPTLLANAREISAQDKRGVVTAAGIQQADLCHGDR